MEKWKIGVIALLIAAFGGFAALQNGSTNPATPNPVNTEAPVQADGTPAPTPKPIESLIGTKPFAWNFPMSEWANVRKPITPADIKGKVTVIEFWRMMCSHCQEAVPFMNQLQKKYKPRGVEMVTFQSPGDLTDPLNPEVNWQGVQNWMKEQGVEYPVAFDAGRKLKGKYNIEFYPMILVVDRQGVIRYAHTGHTEAKARALVQAIETELAKK